jgi:MFS family permease
MTKRIFYTLALASRQLMRRWDALLTMIALYLAMLGAIYSFIATREATIGQLLLSFLLAILAPILFFIIQTMAARYRDDDSGVWRLLADAARDLWKLLVIALPLILLAVLAVYVFGKFEPNTPATAIREAVRSAPAPPRPVTPKPQPVHWQSVLITTLEYLLFCLMLPLAAIHLWIATARDGLKQTLKRSARIVGQAFAPQSVVTYAIGFVFFAVVPYFLIVTKTPVNSAWLDAGLLVARLLLAVLFSLIGWVVTVGALSPRDEEPVVASVDELKECHYPA